MHEATQTLLRLPVLELGGTHVTAAVVVQQSSEQSWSAENVIRVALDSDADGELILDRIALAASQLDVAEPCHWGMALPGPFDYEAGIGDFEGVEKFAGLAGISVRDGLIARVPAMSSISFINDAAAFGLGEAVAGAGAGTRRCVFITLGTGVGSAFIADGNYLTHGLGVPENGWIHTVEVDGLPLEETISRRALMAAAGGREVADTAALAKAGDAVADEIFATAYRGLARGLAPLLADFEAQRLVVGGSIAGSWSLVERHLVPALTDLDVHIPVVPAAEPEISPLVGAALNALND